MTTIAAIHNKHHLTITADTQITTYNTEGQPTQKNQLQPPQTKLIQKPHHIIGISGDLRTINIIQHHYHPKPPPTNPNKTLHHIHTHIIPLLQKTLKKHTHTPTQDPTQTTTTILLACNTQLYIIDNDYSVLTDQNNIYAIGTGTQYALGALHAQTQNYIYPQLATTTQQTRWTQQAVQTAHHYDPHTGPHTQTLTQTNPNT